MKWISEATGQYWDYLPENACAKSVQVRTYDDVVGPLGILYFTGVIAYVHLLWIRGESILDWRPFFFPFSPLTIAFQHGFALTAILFRFIKSKVTREEEEHSDIRIPLRYLFGRAPPAPAPINEISPVEMKDGSKTEPLNVHNEEFANILGPAKSLVLIVQFAGLIFYLVYCTISIKFFFRRYTHSRHSLVNADYTVLQLSLAGVLLVLLTLPHTPLTPLSLFTSPVPTPSSSYRRANPRLHQAIIFFRDSASPSFYPSRYSTALFTHLQQLRQIFYLEALSALLILTDFGSTPSIPLSAIIRHHDSFGMVPLPELRKDYYWREIGGRVVFALVILRALRNNVAERRRWENEVLEAQKALLEQTPASTSSTRNEKADGASEGGLPTSLSPSSPAGAENRNLWTKAHKAAIAFLNDPLAYTPSVSTLLPVVVVLTCALGTWDRLWPELSEWEIWPADVPCPNQWWDPLASEWERVWRWWVPRMEY